MTAWARASRTSLPVTQKFGGGDSPRCGARPLLLNVTLLNSAAPRSRLAAPPRWIADANGDALTVAFATSGDLDAWVGFLGVRLSVPAAAARWSRAEPRARRRRENGQKGKHTEL